MDGHTRLGQGNEIFPFAAIGLKTQDLKYKGGAPRLEIGGDNVFREGVTVHCATNDGEATVIGSHNLFIIHAHVAHDCVLGDHIIMSGFAGLAGHSSSRSTRSSAGYVAVHQFCRIGKFSMIGGCTKIVQDVVAVHDCGRQPRRDARRQQDRPPAPGRFRRGAGRVRNAYKIIFREDLSTANALAKVEAELPPLPEVKHLVQFIRATERGICK